MNPIISSYSADSEALLKQAPNIRLFVVGTVQLEDNGFSSIVVDATVHIWKDA